ncbi:g706 [Coccomyxa viridis]|uniref:G706 protein n=1 Tax=Coccomyxa viridis TaxID=1274662 RepID=A0ABP1FID7_9CHLO
MAGSQSSHGQHNKPHKRGKKAGASARTKHVLAKEGGRQGQKSSRNAAVLGKAQRQNMAKQLRERKKAEVLTEKRKDAAPPVVALLPLSSEVHVQQLWNLILGAFLRPGSDSKQRQPKGSEAMDEDATTGTHPMVPTLVAVPGKSKQRFMMLPPPLDRADPLSIVDLGKAAEVLLVVVPGKTGAAALDDSGLQALSLLRQLGMPALIGVANGACPDEAANAAAKMKEKAAARKRAAAVLASELSGDNKVVSVDDESDCQQLIRALQEIHPTPPLWRRQRPQLLADAAHFFPSDPEKGTLTLRGYVRNLGLSANQVLHIPGAGDFTIKQMQVLEKPPPLGLAHKGQANGNSASAMEVSASQHFILPNPEQQEQLARENEADDLVGEQTWPTDKEMAEAEEAAKKKRKVPRGTSTYQAAWILDDYGDDEDADEGDELVEYNSDPEEAQAPATIVASEFGGMTEFPDEDDDAMEEDEESMRASEAANVKKRWREQHDDVLFPDEVDTPSDIAARTRFGKFRGLRSWRTSAWDPKENLPREYARVFAFQNPTRAQKRAKALAQAAGQAGDPHSVPAGTYLEVHVADVPTSAAAAVVQRLSDSLQGKSLPLSVFGLLQHETKLSVVNFSVRKSASFEEPLPNKAELLILTGVRSFMARPMFSTDEPNTDRFKMERFLHAGRQTMMTMYTPIAFGPLPLLAFQRAQDGHLQLIASGSLRSCNPDRIVLKKAVLSGYPVKVNKKKAVVRWMFHNREDIQWFRPVDLWTKHGRRGQIKEPVGTHGSMKCWFDAPVKQQDSVCMSLYKRAFPKWPEDLTFA